MQSLAVIESYLDGCKFNEVGCGRRSPGAGKKGRMKGTQWGGREGEKDRGMEHKLSCKKQVQGVTNACA